MRKIFNIKGMHCENCADKIRRFVSEVDGVEIIAIDVAQKTMEVEIQAPATIKDVVEAIEDSGFEVE